MHTCAHFCYKMVQCGIWDWGILERVQQVYWYRCMNNSEDVLFSTDPTSRLVSIRHIKRLSITTHGTLTRYVKLLVAHVPGMPGTFSMPPRVSDLGMHHCMCVTHVPWCMPESLTSGVLWSRWREKRSRHSRCMRNANFSYLLRGPCHNNPG